MFEIEETGFDGLKIITNKIFKDNRGFFLEIYNKKKFASAGIKTEFVQDNQSMSLKNVLRGLHFQLPPHSQSKLVYVTKGEVFDVVVDLRKNSKTFAKHFSIRLSSENKKMLFIPEGFAHGFLSLQDDTIFCYKCSDFYYPQLERTILWNDITLNINWPVSNPIVSNKDKKGMCFNDFNTPF